MDAVISNNNNWQFSEIKAGGIYALSICTITDDTNHLSRARGREGSNEDSQMAGVNTGYADGHVKWRDRGSYKSLGYFTNMEIRDKYGKWFRW